MRLRIERIEAMAGERPPGYVVAVMARGVIDGDWLEISSDALAELRDIYRPARTEPALPGVGVMIGSAASAAAADVSARLRGVPALELTEIARRQAICAGPALGDPCEHFRPSDRRCALCGCFTDYKARLRSQRCPIGKW